MAGGAKCRKLRRFFVFWIAFGLFRKPFKIILILLISLFLQITETESHFTLGRCRSLNHLKTTFDIKAYEGV